MFINHYFPTTIWSEKKPDFVKSLNKASDPYIKEARKTKEAKAHLKAHGDFGRSWHSTSVTQDTTFMDFRNYVGQKCWEFLDHSGFDMTKYQTFFEQMWVQEFAKKGGGHHSAHVHWNTHVNGFYFLKASDKTSVPIFHDPRTGARTTTLHMKPNLKGVWTGHELVHFNPEPGLLMIFPGYLQHEFSVDHGKAPFRFIHFNITAVLKEMAKDV
jgi:uncharacterized protein (TIGR02466 family)